MIYTSVLRHMKKIHRDDLVSQVDARVWPQRRTPRLYCINFWKENRKQSNDDHKSATTLWQPFNIAVNVAFPGHKQRSRREKTTCQTRQEVKKKIETATVHVEGQHIRRERETSLRQKKNQRSESKLAQKKSKTPFHSSARFTGSGRAGLPPHKKPGSGRQNPRVAIPPLRPTGRHMPFFPCLNNK
jgi:hypothetical protein